MKLVLVVARWRKNKFELTTTFFGEVATQFGGQQNLASNKTLNLTKPEPVIHEDEELTSKKEDKTKIGKLPKTNGFRIIQDTGQTATLVSGSDGRIYMANNSAEYDVIFLQPG
ncbi:hypothetical protein N7486_004838 [Penicillium sp. IBT 16267x]|nr:hypothetical protein N7486_004838 [Penicillium sp. IBT 16267x]